MAIVQAAAALALLFFGGDLLVRGASGLAARSGISPLAVGLTVVAFGTSAPELVVSVDAALTGASDIAIGNVVGSNIANIALILGLSVILRPVAVEAKLVRLDAPIMIGVSLVLVGMLASGRVSRPEGLALMTGLAAYVAFTFWQARRESREVRKELSSAAPEAPTSVRKSVFNVLVGLGLLVAGGHLLVSAAVELALSLGVSQAAIGLTIVAVGTSLPELATSVVASLRGQGDIAVGNVVGSNIFNILGILGVTAVLRPLPMGEITWLDLGVMLALACGLLAFLSLRNRLARVEGVLLLASFAAYTGCLLVA